MRWTGCPSGQDLLQEQPNRGKDTAKALIVFQGCSVTQETKRCHGETTRNNKLRTEERRKTTVGAHN